MDKQRIRSLQTTIFLHIPKTAGTTLRTILSNQYWPGQIQNMYEHGAHGESADRLVALARRSPTRVRAVTGHIGYGLHRMLPGEASYITILREPVVRVASMYDHIRRSPPHPFYKPVSRMSLADYANSDIDESASNSQTRFLSSVKFSNELEGRDDDGGSGKMSPEQMLEEAMHNVSQNITVTGLSERFDETLMLLRARLGWRRLYYASLNKRRGNSVTLRLTASSRDAIAERNELDLRLYRHACECFEQALEDTLPSIQDQLPRFVARNRYLGAFYSYPARIVQKSRELLTL